MLLSGLNSIGLNLNSRRLAQRAEDMDVFCNPVALCTLKLCNKVGPDKVLPFQASLDRRKHSPATLRLCWSTKLFYSFLTGHLSADFTKMLNFDVGQLYSHVADNAFASI
jgi:hypothetical protein